jgi:hypothetical protein
VVHYHDFLVELPRYAALGKANDFPTLNCCPICRAKNRLQRHGFYERNVISEECSFRIPICRLLCPDCGRTVSILPMFVLPYFQYTVDIILRILLAFWMTCGLCTRQQRRFYEKRVYGKLTEMEMFFREGGFLEMLPITRKEKAIKMIQMIQALGKATYLRRWWRHRTNSFMAAPLYHGARVAKTE